MSAMCRLALVTILPNLPVTAFATGGTTMAEFSILWLLPFYYCVMVAAATVLATTSSNRIYKRWSMTNGIEIRIAHYPPYTSKYNPIEHRLFPHLSRVCQGVIFHSIEIVQELMATARTRTGLKVFTTILDKTYHTGRKVADDFKSTMKIVFDDILPQWNYIAQPQLQVI